MWHPVGALPASVYWRRRLVLLTVVLAVLGGATWGTLAYLDAQDDGATDTTTAASGTAVRVPALERVVSQLGPIAMPTPPDVAKLAADAAAAAAAKAAPVVPAAPAPVAGGPCTDDMIALAVGAPGTVAAGSKPTFELVLRNVSAVPCVRPLDKGLREIGLLNAAGARVWGSNDCFPEASSEPRVLAPGEVVGLPVVWGGLTSEPTCTAVRATPAPGSYTLVGRLGTKLSASTPIVIG